MRIVFVGESWVGSSARSLREALARQESVVIEEIDPNHFLPKHSTIALRLVNRLVGPWQRAELGNAIREAVRRSHPDAVVIYKGAAIGSALIVELQRGGCPVINIFPDYSPHVYGRRLEDAVGRNDLVISTKPFHPALWHTVYGYRNRCVFVPHGYDPEVHSWSGPASSQEYDVALCATWRPEYHRLMRSFAGATGTNQMSVAIAGSGWEAHLDEFPRHWQLSGPRFGRAYGEFLRAARIALAPVTREVFIRGVQQPGDEDTTRTYELAAAYCFFLHQRTEFVATLYDERNEVPLWRDASELVSLVQRWLPDEAGRMLMAARAHRRAVPAYSIPERAATVRAYIADAINSAPTSRAVS